MQVGGGPLRAMTGHRAFHPRDTTPPVIDGMVLHPSASGAVLAGLTPRWTDGTLAEVATTDPTSGAGQPPPAAPAGVPHDHRWAGVAFFLEDDHPWFRMRCACGAERTIRAWERYSDPEPDADAPTERPAAGAPAPATDG